MAAMTYDREGDVLFIELAGDGPDTEGEEVYPGVMLLFDANGALIGIEITSASKILSPGAVESLPAVVVPVSTAAGK